MGVCVCVTKKNHMKPNVKVFTCRMLNEYLCERERERHTESMCINKQTHTISLNKYMSLLICFSFYMYVRMYVRTYMVCMFKIKKRRNKSKIFIVSSK